MQSNTSKPFTIIIIPLLIIVYFFFLLGFVDLKSYPNAADILLKTSFLPLLFPLLSILCGILPARKNMNAGSFIAGLVSIIVLPIIVSSYWSDTMRLSAGTEVTGLFIPAFIGLLFYLVLASSFWKYFSSAKR